MQKIVKVCPDCDSTVRIADRGSDTEHAKCYKCKGDFFLDELRDRKEIILSFRDDTGRRVYYKKNEHSTNKQRLSLMRFNTIKKRAKGLSYRDKNTLKRLRK